MAEEPEETTEVSYDPSKVLVRAFQGFLWSPLTLKLYYAATREEVGPATYFRPFSVNIGYGFEDPIVPLSPLDYPTPESAGWILNWAIGHWPTLHFDIISAHPTGGFVTAKQYGLLVNNGADLYGIFGAGLWIFDENKDGDAAAYEQRTAELRAAGFSV